MARRISCSPLHLLPFALAAGGCDSSSPAVPNPSTGSAIALIVSEPARGVEGSRGAIGAGIAGSLRLNDGAAYVSAEPGAVPNASAVEIENLRLQETTPVQLVAGGFDPVTIPALVGDSIEFRFKLTGGGVTAVRAEVPARRRPRVVRTHPARGRRDVAINSIIITVFSEPINPTTLRDSTVRLLRDGVAVRGTVRTRPGLVPTVEFVPAEPLAPATTYRLELDGRILDLSGDPLEVPDPVEFVTFREGGTGALTVITRTAGTDAPEGYDLMVDGNVAARLGLSDTVVITGLGSGGHHILLSAMSDYCYASGGLYRQVSLSPTQDATVTYDVTCTDLPKLVLSVTTGGDQPDDDGYDVAVNGIWGDRVAPNGTLELSGLRYGTNLVTLSGVRGNCRDAGTLRRIVYLTSGQVGSVSFSLSCTPAFTPAGRIAFASSNPDGTSAITVADADGSNRVQLTSGTERDRMPTWSPDGTQIAFVRAHAWGEAVFVMSADDPDGEMNSVGGGTIVRHLTWMPDGQQLAYVPEWDQVYVVNAPYRDHPQTNFSLHWSPYNDLGWSPVDARIAQGTSQGLRITDRSGSYLGEVRNVFPGAGTWSSPAWSPDGRSIAVVACRDLIDGECTTLSLEILPVVGTWRTVIPLPGWAHRPVWSPDAKTLAYTQCIGCPGITYMRTDGRGTSVTIADGFDPAWKP
jgi:Tol biopolymer transport system component